MQDSPISLTEKALRQILKVRDSDPDLGKAFSVRISLQGGALKTRCHQITFLTDPNKEYG